MANLPPAVVVVVPVVAVVKRERDASSAQPPSAKRRITPTLLASGAPPPPPSPPPHDPDHDCLFVPVAAPRLAVSDPAWHALPFFSVPQCAACEAEHRDLSLGLDSDTAYLLVPVCAAFFLRPGAARAQFAARVGRDDAADVCKLTVQWLESYLSAADAVGVRRDLGWPPRAGHVLCAPLSVLERHLRRVREDELLPERLALWRALCQAPARHTSISLL